jgi:hypothetical protein
LEPFRSILTRPTRAWPQGGEYSERHRLSGYSYDANGNQLSTSYVYDAENRIAFSNVSGGMVEYTPRTSASGWATPDGFIGPHFMLCTIVTG